MDVLNAHHIAERTRLLSHEAYAALIDVDGSLVDQARSAIEAAIGRDGGTTGQRLWRLILCRSWSEIRTRMLEDSPEGRLLRSNSPFSTLIGIRDPDERTKLWRQAKRDLSDPTMLTSS